jgi:tRNA threonylcarbamoyl adenosine modification protein YeaZ
LLSSNGPDCTIFARRALMARGHAEALMPMVAEVMAEGGVAFAELDVIAATTGPGSFTGVRIAIAAARGLALVTRAKLFGTDSLTVMAKVASATETWGNEPFAVAVDARRGMVYVGLYDGEARKLHGPSLLAPDDAAKLLPATACRVVGNGGAVVAEAAARRGARVEARLGEIEPDAAALAAIALNSGETSPSLRPLYLRPPDARPQPEAQMARR